MRTSLRARALEFAQEFDGELTRTYAAFHVDGDRLASNPAATLADAYARSQSSTTVPGLIRAVYLFQRHETDDFRRFDLEQHTVAPSEWLRDLILAREAAARMPSLPGVPAPMFI